MILDLKQQTKYKKIVSQTKSRVMGPDWKHGDIIMYIYTSNPSRDFITGSGTLSRGSGTLSRCPGTLSRTKV